MTTLVKKHLETIPPSMPMAGGVIVFLTESGSPISKVNADDKSSPVKLAHGGFRTFFLPDGPHFLYGDPGENTGITMIRWSP